MGKVTGNERFWVEFSGKSIISKIPVFPFLNGNFQSFGKSFGYPYHDDEDIHYYYITSH